MRKLTRSALIALCSALSIFLGSSALAAPNAARWASATAFVPVAPHVCTLNTVPPNTGKVEYDVGRAGASCSNIVVTLGTGEDGTGPLPKVTQSGLLAVKITSDQHQPPGEAPLTITVPAGLNVTKLPDGFTQAVVSDPFGLSAANQISGQGEPAPPVKGDGSSAAVISGNVTLNPGGSATVTFDVEVTSGGSGTIAASLDDPGGGQGTNGSLSFTFGIDASDSGFIAAATAETAVPTTELSVRPPKNYTSAAGLCPGGTSLGNAEFCPGVDELLEPTDPNQVKPTNARKKAARALGLAIVPNKDKHRTKARSGILATTCVIGRMVYSDQSGIVHPSVNLPVIAVDDNPFDTDTVGSQVTDGDGRFNMCFDNQEHSFWESGTADVILKFKTQNARWRVVNRCCADDGVLPGAYQITTPRREDIAAGTTNYGTMTAGDASFQRALHLYDEYNIGWQFANAHSPAAGTCWAASDCDQKTAMWANNHTSNWPSYGNCGSRLDSIVCLPANAPDWEAVVLHELGHDLMDNIYPDGIPDHDCPNPHTSNTAEEVRCAWTEGWPSWYSNAVMGAAWDTGYGGQSVMFTARGNYENMSWQDYSTIVRGSNVEARVTMSLWDLADSADEAPWDRSSIGSEAVWRAFLSGSSSTMTDFVTRLGNSRGVDVGPSSDARSTLYGNTIDLGGSTFRDTLSTSWLNRQMPPVAPPSLTAIPMGSTASPTNTSNNQAFVWDRPDRASACPDLIQAEDTWGRGTYYKSTSNARDSFQYNAFGIDAFSNAATTTNVGASDRVDLQQARSVSLELPQTPRRIWVTTRGAAPAGATNGVNGGIAPGDWTQPMLTHYRLRGSRCFALQLGVTTTLAATPFLNTAVFMTGGTHYVLRVAPHGTSAGAKAANVNLALIRGRKCPTKSEAKAAKCKYDSRPVAKSDKAGKGKREKLVFDAPASGMYRLVGETKSGAAIGWDVKVSRIPPK